jgi:hypothetical protein
VKQKRAIAAVSLCGIVTSVIGCSTNNTDFALPPSRAVVLPVVNCQLVVVRVTPIPTDRTELDGEIRTVIPGYSAGPAIVGATAYGGVFVATLRTNSGARFVKLLPWGSEAGTASELSAIARNSDGSVTLVDAFLRRRTTVGADGQYVGHLMLRPPPTTDAYGLDQRGVFVVATEASKEFSERVPGSVSRLVDDSRFVKDSSEFATPSRHISPEGSEVLLGQRPLESNPIVAIGRNGQMAINTSDSLELLYTDSHGTPSRLAGNGPRTSITASEMDSASAAFARQLMPRDPEPTAKYAREHMFVGRSRHQLLDAVIVLPDDRVALRRTRACPDRQLWYILDVRRGVIVDAFAAPRDLSPLLADGDTIFAEHRPKGNVEFAWFTASGTKPDAARPLRVR